MGWGNCGKDSNGRPIGYNFQATCDHSDCKEKIDRGLGYACGGMHGEETVIAGIYSCEKYFCEKHRIHISFKREETPKSTSVCSRCEKWFDDNPGFKLNKESGEYESLEWDEKPENECSPYLCNKCKGNLTRLDDKYIFCPKCNKTYNELEIHEFEEEKNA